MEILPLHIEYLLTRHDCVIVPGIGALIVSEKDAEIDTERGIVTPRRREISFNSSVITDDGLLSHSIAMREKLSYEDARRLLERLTAKMASDLKSEGEVSLDRVGRLVCDSEGCISFQPRKTILESDILTDARLTPRISRTGESTSETKIDNPTVFQEEEKTLQFRHIRTIEVPADRYVFTINRKIAHVAAMLAVVITIGLSLLIPVNHADEQKASVVPVDEFLRRPLMIEHNIQKDPENDTTKVSEPYYDRMIIDLPLPERFDHR